MFGVLLVKTRQEELGYLAAYSGKLAGGYHQSRFVPPVYDGLQEGSFLNLGMRELTRINLEIKSLEVQNSPLHEPQLQILKARRRQNSIDLQEKIFEQYRFLNRFGEEKNLREIFQNKSGGKAPSGAGECAAPKLLQYAFQQQMQPLALAEFWWGLSPKSDFWKHGHFYPACRDKCEPILAHMLAGMTLDEPRV